MSVQERFPDLPRLLVALMTAVLVVVVGSTYATAQTSEPVSTGPLTAPAVSGGVERGEEVRLSGAGYAPGASIDITIESTPRLLTTVTAGATGAFSVIVEIPAGFPAGSHTLKATGADPTGGLRVLSVPVTVEPATGQSSGSGSLVRTGSNTTLLVGVGVAAIAGGSALLRARRRRA